MIGLLYLGQKYIADICLDIGSVTSIGLISVVLFIVSIISTVKLLL